MGDDVDNVRLELVWPNKDKFLLSPTGNEGKPVWVGRDHPAAREVRLTEYSDSCGDVNEKTPASDNLLFLGDSLDALRVLTESPEFRREYRGKVKLIYCDPPFNTGQTFEHYDDWMEHSTWLSFMLDRLNMMKDLLAADGSIWIHLDDAEQHRMRMLMDDVFGSGNFVANFIWEKKKKPSFLHRQVATVTDTIMVYAKSRPNLESFTYGGSTENKGIPFHNTGNAFGEMTFPEGSVTFTLPDQTVSAGDMSTATVRTALLDDVNIVNGTNANAFRMNGEWRYSQAAVDELVAAGETIRISRPQFRPNYIRQEALAKKITNLFSFRVNDIGTNEDAKAECVALFGAAGVFDTPKPESLLARIISVATSTGDIVMDFFGGSGTTAAVAHKMKRRWVTVELSPSNVEKFTKKRLQKVVSGEDQGGVSTEFEWAGGGGFRKVDIQNSFYVVTPLGVLLAEDAVGERFARAVAGQLGFDWAPTSISICGQRGRMRLAVFDGTIGIEEVTQVLSELGEQERVLIVGHSILEGAEEWLTKNSPGSAFWRAPTDILRERKRRNRPTIGGDQ